MNRPGEVITLKTDNRYKNGKVVKKDGVLRGNDETMQIIEVPHPDNPLLTPVLLVGESLAHHLTTPQETK